ncbi:glycoside hydrolase [Aestuariibaculum sediminum]|uniref:Xylanase n=1 Tax=Aestuariibaculum sediminum TaxID=2770637 RepID=A0A8J6Q8F3_9FLAO|nr:glycoside hydrolase [Aestuariibaculum sediminum]MBD0831537.1 xylanase [Aestuariibaculum sediminum]
MKKIRFILILISFVFQVAAQSNLKNTDILEIEINPEITHQTIRNFGASDAWSTQFVGKYWPEDAKQAIAKLLFSKAIKSDGSPEGIGLSAWRFNIGAGSAEQGSESEILDEWRRSECFLNQDGTYNWDKQQGQLWFIKAAKQYGVETFIGFVNSPPVFYTKNGKAWSSDGSRANLKQEYYKNYANFLSEVLKGVKQKTGITFDYVSPFNEPQWAWECCKQEGSPWTNEELFLVTHEIHKSFIKNKISSKIEITEAAKIDYLYTAADKPNRGNQIDYFFNKKSEGYLGYLPSVAKKVAGHSYFTTWNNNTLINTRNALNQKRQEIDPDLEYWMTEYCVLEDNKEIRGAGRDLGIDAALYVAKVIHADLVYSNASAWHWWLAISPYNYKDGLIYIDKNKEGGQFSDSKMLWVLGHYSRFIKPRMRRIDVNKKVETNVLVSAYASKDEIVLVMVNIDETDKKIMVSGVPKSYKLEACYETTGEAFVNLKKRFQTCKEANVLLPKRSLLTCVFENQVD